MDDYQRVANAIRFIQQSVTGQPSVDEIAQAAGISTSHCQRLFRRWAGVSPKRFLEYLTVQHAKTLLDQSASVLDTAFQVGLSGPSRLHDQFVSVEAVSPGEYQRRGKELIIRYGHHESAFGDVLIALTDRGICGLAFCATDGVSDETQRLQALWPEARLRRSQADTRSFADRLARAPDAQHPVSLLVTGTNFQLKIWEALLRVPRGTVCTYGRLAQMAGHPGSARATGSAVGANHIAWYIPCHRVIRSSGASGQYRWGETRKRAMLAWESAQQEAAAEVAAS